MIQSLYIRNFAIIDELAIDFDTKMTVLTGETGAGKSIIIDALGQLIGDRFQSNLIKDGQDKAFIEGVFNIKNHPSINELLESYGFAIEDNLLTISKELTTDGRSNYRLNYRPTTLQIIKQIMPKIVDIHSQHDNQYLLNVKTHLQLLDTFAHKQLSKPMNNYQEAYQNYLNSVKELQNALDTSFDETQIEFMEYQLNEINEADIKDQELEQLEQEERRIKDFEKISQSLNHAQTYLRSENGALSSIAYAIKEVEIIDDSTFNEAGQLLHDGYYQIEAAMDLLSSVGDELIYDENYLNQIQERIFKINKIKRKYGQSYEEIEQFRLQLSSQIESFIHRNELIEELTIKKDQLYLVAYKQAKILSQIRNDASSLLTKAITEQLHALYMENVIFEVAFIENKQLDKNGYDQIEFLISLNPGQSPKSLAKIASGGELSRLMLGLKTIFSHLNDTNVIVFDEVDTGVSGKVASAIGAKMQEISSELQVLCITHLPQVAGYANHHLHVFKTIKDNQTIVSLSQLDYPSRVKEMAKMLSGEEINEMALENAKALIKHG